MNEIQRVSPEYTYGKVASGEGCLICAYDDNEKFKQFHLKGALSLEEFTNQVKDIPKEKELIFYCG